MTAGKLYRLSQQLRLLARAGIALDQEGRKLHGEINAEVEAARLQIEEFIDQLLDGHGLAPGQQAHVTWCQELAQLNRPAIRQLELEVCPF
jgi:hypothetical protein